MKCCVSIDVGTSGHGRTDQLLSPIRIIVRMQESDCFLRYRIGYGTLQPCLGCKRAALLRGILRRENPTYTYWRRAARASRGFKMVLFTEPSEDLCRRQVRSTECPSSFNFLPIKLQFIVRSLCSLSLHLLIIPCVCYLSVKH